MNSKVDFIAAMKDEKYWNERAEKLFKSIEKNEEQLNKKLAEYYKVEAERLNKLIASYYAKYGKDNVIQYRELLKKLSDGERKLLIEDIDKFIEKYPKYENLKKVRESIYKLDRLESLKVSINLSQMELAEKEVEEVKKYLEDVYKTGFDYANKELGYPTNFNSYNKEAVEKFINKSWVGGINFSKRIYNNRDKVSKWVMTEFADGVKRGESYDSLIKKMMNRFQEVSKSSAKRLVTTEASYILNESSMKVFEDEFDEYKYNAMLDAKTSKLCRRLDGEVYKISERKAGKNFPPMHPNCRSSFTIVIPDDWMDRAIKKQEDINDFESFKKSGVDTINNVEEFRKIKYNNSEEWNDLNGYFKIVENGEISPMYKYSNYKAYHNDLKKELIGLQTKDGIEIKGLAYHFSSRSIGTHDWANENNSKELMKKLNHKHVPKKNIIECIKKGNVLKETEKSKVYEYNGYAISINHKTGKLIQCNPIKKGMK